MSVRRPRPAPTRRYPRLTVRVEVTLETPARSLDAVATTLGAGGLFVAGEFPLELGQPLRAHFQLPGEDATLRLAARIAWHSTPGGEPGSVGLGVEFVDPAARAQLAAHLEAWARRREAVADG